MQHAGESAQQQAPAHVIGHGRRCSVGNSACMACMEKCCYHERQQQTPPAAAAASSARLWRCGGNKRRLVETLTCATCRPLLRARSRAFHHLLPQKNGIAAQPTRRSSSLCDPDAGRLRHKHRSDAHREHPPARTSICGALTQPYARSSFRRCFHSRRNLDPGSVAPT